MLQTMIMAFWSCKEKKELSRVIAVTWPRTLQWLSQFSLYNTRENSEWWDLPWVNRAWSFFRELEVDLLVWIHHNHGWLMDEMGNMERTMGNSLHILGVMYYGLCERLKNWVLLKKRFGVLLRAPLFLGTWCGVATYFLYKK